MMRATLLALAVPLAACGAGRVLSGPTVVGGGIHVAPRSARLDMGTLEVLLDLENQTGSHMRFEPHHTVLIGPDGAVYPEAWGERSFDLAPRRNRRIRVVFADLDWKLEHAPGFFLRLGGFYLDDVLVPMPAMPLGHPVTDAEGRVHVRRVVTAEHGVMLDSTCALLPLGDDAVTAAVRERLEAAGWTVVPTEGKLTGEARAAAARCSDRECIREVGGALGVPYLVGGSVADVDADLVLTLRLMDVTTGQVSNRANTLVAGSDRSQLVRAAADRVVETLVGLD